MSSSIKIKTSVDHVINQIRAKTDFIPQVALILGSGLGALADEIEPACIIDYNDLEGFPISTVEGHKGRFVFGNIGDVKVVIMQGRVHYYEGYTMQEVVMPVRVMAGLGAKILYITNASGGMNTSFKAGDLMLITDQISSFVPSPLIGENVDEWGTRFPSMNDIYDCKLRKIIEETAEEKGIKLRQGTYLQTTGPQYESPAEVRMFRSLGGDAVGMSSAVEAITARHMDMRVCGVSCITNMAAGISKKPLDHKEVQEIADRVSKQFAALVTKVILNI
ncbi:MAG: purine-nucleoside phosphorylase [Eubacterium sp.]|nr:purine-nucleoside phosphorylase [Eubacterium sp.]